MVVEVLLEPGELAHALVDTLVDMQATDVVLLDLTDISSWADHFIVATVDNVRQSRAIVDAIDSAARARGMSRLHPEGDPSSGWVLIDVGDGLVVHLFSDEGRAYYNLEGLWTRAQEVVRIQ